MIVPKEPIEPEFQIIAINDTPKPDSYCIN